MNRLGQFSRSIGVGAVATVVDLVLLIVLIEAVSLSPVEANVPALGIGLAIQFFGNKFFAFEDHSRSYAKQGAQFALVEAGSLTLNAFLFHLIMTWASLPYAVVRLVCSAIIYIGFSYPLWRRVFRPTPRHTGVLS